MNFYYKGNKYDVGNCESQNPTELPNVSQDYEYRPVYGSWKAGHYYDMDGSFVKATTEMNWGQPFSFRANATDYEDMIPCVEGERYRIKTWGLHRDSDNVNPPNYVVFDEDKSPIFIPTEYPKQDGEYHYFTIPKGGKWLAYVSTSGGYGELHRLGIKPNKTYINGIIEGSYNSFIRTAKPTLKTLTKGYICVGTDDMRNNHTYGIHKMYTDANVPYYISCIPEVLKTTVSGGEGYLCNLDYCRMCVEHGGEICVHNNDPITSETIDSYDALYDYFVEKKIALESYGFNIRGIITAGGYGMIAKDPRINRWASAFYDFNDTMGDGFPYGFGRSDMEYMTHANMDSVVNDVCVNHSFRVLYTHVHNDVVEDNFSYLMEKLSAYNRGADYEFVTPSQLYDILMK